jgi:glucose dehydrogenase
MASVDLCGQIAGTCIGGDDLTASRQAVFSVIAFALATALLFVRRSPARDAVFAALVLAGEAWLLAKALERDLPPLPLAVAATIVVQLGYEAAVRLARSRRGAAPAA